MYFHVESMVIMFDGNQQRKNSYVYTDFIGLVNADHDHISNKRETVGIAV